MKYPGKRSNLLISLRFQKATCVFLPVLVFLLGISEREASADSFRVSGLLSVTNYTQDGEVWRTRKLKTETFTNGLFTAFTAEVSGRSWRIKTTFSAEHWQDLTYDGTNMFTVLYDYSGVGKTSPIPAILATEAYPLDTTWYASIPWLALASSFYLDGTNNLPAPWLLPRVDPQAYVFDTEVIRSKAVPHLPTSVRFVASASAKSHSIRNNYLEKEMQNALDNGEISRKQSVFPDGFVGADYVVLSKTTVGGLEIPSEFVLRRFRPSYVKKGQLSGGLFEVYYGRVTSAETCHPGVYVPSISNRTDITDKRFRDPKRKVDYIAYEWTNTFWPDRKDPALLALYEKKVSRVPRFNNPRVTVRHIVFIALCASLISLPIISLIRYVKTNRRIESNNSNNNNDSN